MRIVLALVAAIVANIAIVGGSEFVIHQLYPPPAGTDLSRPADMAAIVASMALPAKIGVLVAWALGSLAAAWVALTVSRGVRWTAWAAVVLPFAGVAYSLYAIPHPLWMAIIGLIIPPLAAALIAVGGRAPGGVSSGYR